MGKIERAKFGTLPANAQRFVEDTEQEIAWDDPGQFFYFLKGLAFVADMKKDEAARLAAGQPTSIGARRYEQVADFWEDVEHRVNVFIGTLELKSESLIARQNRERSR